MRDNVFLSLLINMPDNNRSPLQSKGLYAWVAIFFSVLVWSAAKPKDLPTRVLEVAPAIIGFVVIALTHRVFRLTTLVYILILLHSIILMVGGHYTYAEVPLFDTFREIFDLERNNYDKVGHFAQGYVWDTQSDMLYALTGALLALVLLARLHDRQLDALQA